MPQMTNSQARVINPILTEAARGYQNGEMVGEALFPLVPVGQRGGKIIEFSREHFRLYATGRTPGANTRRVQFGHEGSDYAIEQHALEGVVPIEHQEEAEEVPGIDLGQGAVTGVQDIIALRAEKAQADLARNAASYATAHKVDLTGDADRFSTDGSDPTAVINAGISAIRKDTGKRPTVALVPAAVMEVLNQHPAIIDRIKYTGRDSITPEMLASLWGIPRVVVGDAVYEADGALEDVWGKDVVLAYSQVGTVNNRGLPSYGYTYRLRNYPIVEEPYYHRNTKSWIYPVTDEVRPVLSGADAGYLIQNAVA